MEKVFKFEFTFSEIRVLMKGCEELPFKLSAPVREKIIMQYDKQVAEQVELSKVNTEEKEDVKE